MAQLGPRADEIAGTGARLIVIGNGWPAMAKDFAEKSRLPASMMLLTDPSLQSYAAAGLKRGALLTLGPRGWIPYLMTMKRGFHQGRVKGDPWQQGGALVLASGGKVLFRHVSTRPSDQVAVQTLVDALRKRAA